MQPIEGMSLTFPTEPGSSFDPFEKVEHPMQFRRRHRPPPPPAQDVHQTRRHPQTHQSQQARAMQTGSPRQDPNRSSGTTSYNSSAYGEQPGLVPLSFGHAQMPAVSMQSAHAAQVSFPVDAASSYNPPENMMYRPPKPQTRQAPQDQIARHHSQSHPPKQARPVQTGSLGGGSAPALRPLLPASSTLAPPTIAEPYKGSAYGEQPGFEPPTFSSAQMPAVSRQLANAAELSFPVEAGSSCNPLEMVSYPTTYRPSEPHLQPAPQVQHARHHAQIHPSQQARPVQTGSLGGGSAPAVRPPMPAPATLAPPMIAEPPPKPAKPRVKYSDPQATVPRYCKGCGWPFIPLYAKPRNWESCTACYNSARNKQAYGRRREKQQLAEQAEASGSGKQRK